MAKKQKQNKKLSELLNLPVILADGITSEEVKPYYYDSTKLVKYPEPMFRLDVKGRRYYYRLVEGESIFYTSVTTMIKDNMPTPKALLKWMVDQDNGEEEMMERAFYGTVLHAMFAELLINGKYDLDKLPEELAKYGIKENTTIKPEWAEELKKDLLALSQFVIDYHVVPLAIEVILYHPNDGYAGALDLVCTLDYTESGHFGEVYASGVNKGQPKLSKRTIRAMAIVDLKSGRKGFYESHEIQLESYRQMWNVHYPDFPITKTFNLSPKEWRTKPSYNLKEQSDAKSKDKLPHLVNLAKIEEERHEKTVTVMSGTIDLAKGIECNYKEITLTELVK